LDQLGQEKIKTMIVSIPGLREKGDFLEKPF
jgi:hypothetical protein